MIPAPRLANHLDTDIGPSDEEGGKEAKRQKSEPTTPISTSSRPPNEYDEVMGITSGASPAPCRSRVEIDETSNPQQVMSPNVEEEPIYDHEQVPDIVPEDQLLPKDEPQSRVKEERKDEEVTPKSEPAAVETKEESSDQDVGDQDSDNLHEELQRRIDEFPPHDSEDSLGP